MDWWFYSKQHFGVIWECISLGTWCFSTIDFSHSIRNNQQLKDEFGSPKTEKTGAIFAMGWDWVPRKMDSSPNITKWLNGGFLK